MRRTLRSLLALALALSLALAIAACGGNDNDSGSSGSSDGGTPAALGYAQEGGSGGSFAVGRAM